MVASPGLSVVWKRSVSNWLGSNTEKRESDESTEALCTSGGKELIISPFV